MGELVIEGNECRGEGGDEGAGVENGGKLLPCIYRSSGLACSFRLVLQILPQLAEISRYLPGPSLLDLQDVLSF